MDETEALQVRWSRIARLTHFYGGGALMALCTMSDDALAQFAKATEAVQREVYSSSAKPVPHEIDPGIYAPQVPTPSFELSDHLKG